MTHKSERVLSVTELSRVEGEGALYVRTVGDRVEEARLDIYEPPRFFEAFLRGRAYTEPPDITARICGICPVAYQMSACAAIEDACGVTVPEQVTALRRLLYCGEWIESHALHIYLLHAPDFLGYASGIEMASHRRDLVERGLQLKKAGNAVMEAVGGRAIHPVNVRLGGFYRAPARAELTALTEPLKRALDGALETVRWVAGFDFPDHACDADLLALTHPGTYAIERGTLATRSGLAFPAARFDEQVIEEHVPHSTALHAHLAGGGRYLTGPLARYALGSRWLSPLAREAARAAGLGETCDNPFRSIVVRAVETVYAVEEALRLIAAYEPPEPAAVEVPSRAATGYGVTEAPRGTLYHRYQIGADGLITAARIVPPTSQNQAAIEADLATFVQAHLDLDDAELTRRCEQAIRNYDPCISCSAHFLDLTVERSLSGRTVLVHAPAATHADRGDLGPGDSGPRLLAVRPLAGWAEGSMAGGCDEHAGPGGLRIDVRQHPCRRQQHRGRPARQLRGDAGAGGRGHRPADRRSRPARGRRPDPHARAVQRIVQEDGRRGGRQERQRAAARSRRLRSGPA